MDKKNVLEERFIKAIKESNFNVLEIKGFAERPDLALLAGVAIGYRLGSQDMHDLAVAGFINLIQKEENSYGHFKVG